MTERHQRTVAQPRFTKILPGPRSGVRRHGAEDSAAATRWARRRRLRLRNQASALAAGVTVAPSAWSRRSRGLPNGSLAVLLAAGRIARVTGSYIGANKEFARQYLAGELEVELS